MADNHTTQSKQEEWHFQWETYHAETEFLFSEWIYPRTLQDFRDQMVFDAGCGRGHHVKIVARVAAHITGMDLNAADIARDELSENENITILEGDIASFHPDSPFDVVYCIGVIHHTNDPDKTFQNLKNMTRPGGLLIIWCYSREGNWLVERVVEPLRKGFLNHGNHQIVVSLSWLLTFLLYPIIYTVYLLPVKTLPYYEYFQNFRRLGLQRNMLNIFDKLNAPQTQFIDFEQIKRWFTPDSFSDIHITLYKGVSWRGSGVVK